MKLQTKGKTLRSLNRRKLAAQVAMSVVAVCMFGAAGVQAQVTPSVTTTFSDPRLGAHSDFVLKVDFSYGATGTVPSGLRGVPPIEDPATYVDTTDFRETVKDTIVDIPPGLVGNPNAIPFDERCEISDFETGNCPESATIGSATVLTTLIQLNEEEANDIGDYFIQPEPGDTYLSFRIGPQTTYNPGSTSQHTRLSLLKTSPEVPAKLGLMVEPPLNAYRRIHQVLEITPDTNGDLRLRTDAPDIAHQLISKATGVHVGNLRISSFEIALPGRLPNGAAFMTNPTECAPWQTNVWARSYRSNPNLDSDPRRVGVNEFAAGGASTVIPDCSNQLSIPFPITGKVEIGTAQRDTSPEFDFTITNPGVFADGDSVSTTPKKIVARVPASINVDVQQLGRTCTEVDFDADSCPATSRVGSVKIETPLLLPGLTGDVYLVKKPTAGLPDLGLRLRGAITFTQRGSNRYVGPRGNEIETTFDNIPQLGFSKLSFHLDGGPNGLLRSLACPISNKQPAASEFSYQFTSWTGATAGSTTNLNMADCFGIQKLRKFGCVYRVLRFQPTYTSRARMKRSVLYVKRGKRYKKISTARRSPFGFKVKAKRFKKGWNTFEVRATYDDGKVLKKRSKFKRC